MPSTSGITSPKTPRFHFLDALRGLAALSVVLHHSFFSSVMVTVYQKVSPALLRFLFEIGAHGVEIFFVLSGFVIAHSLRNNDLSLGSLGRFIMRRQVRLDPPYWAALALGLFFLWARNHLPGVVRTPLPSPSELLLNATYLHEIFRLSKEATVLEVAWTLCLEIQFYLLFILVLWVSHDTPRQQTNGEDSPAVSNRAVTVMWASGIACLITRHFVVDASYFWVAWHYFVAGTLAYWTVTRKAAPVWIASLLLAFVLSAAATKLSVPIHRGHFTNSANPLALFVGGTTALLLWQLGVRDKLGIWRDARPLQYLGRISYSLYLTHVPVLLMALRFAYKITRENVPAAFGWMVVCIALCIGIAHLFYLLIERPSLRWANAISKNEPPSSPTSGSSTRLFSHPHPEFQSAPESKPSTQQSFAALSMKFKTILFCSLILNLLILGGVGAFIARRGGLSFVQNQLKGNALTATGEMYFDERRSIFAAMPKHEGAIVFLGDSMIERCPWNELFQRDNILVRGIGGQNLDGVLKNIPEVARHKPQKVFIMAGTNDLIQGKSKEQVVNLYKQLVTNLKRQSPGSTLILQSILPIGNQPFSQSPEAQSKEAIRNSNQQIADIDKQIRKMADGKKILYCDVARSVTKNGQLNSVFSADGLHLNGEGYMKWKAAVLPVLGNAKA